jgi:hypothetical protein
VYKTGRYCFPAMQLIDEGRLPLLNTTCGNVGTDRIDLGDPQNALGREYAAQGAHPWDLETICALGKGKTVAFLQRKLGLDPAQVAVASDTGNDLEMFEKPYQGILPVNALEKLKAAARPWRHFQSQLPAGRGLLDGLCHFGFIARMGLR